MKSLYLATDSETDCMGIYDHDKNLIRFWQAGDDMTRILKDIFNRLGFQVQNASFSIDGDVPQKL